VGAAVTLAVPLAALVALLGANHLQPEQARGQGAGSESTGKTYIGAVKGAPMSARIGLVADNQGQFLIYVCSQDSSFNQSHSRWFKGKVGANGSIAADSPDGVHVAGAVQGDTAEGTLAGKDGKALAWQAALVAADKYAGLYRQEYSEDGIDYVAGWIIDPADEVAGAVLNKTKKATATVPQGQPITGQKVTTGSGGTSSTGDGSIKLGVSKKAADALLKAATNNDKAQEAKAAKIRAAIGTALDKDLKQERALVAAALQKHPDFAAFTAELKKLEQQSQGKKLSLKDLIERNTALAQIFGKHQKLFDDVLKQAKVDQGKVTAAVRKQFGAVALIEGKLGTLLASAKAIKAVPLPSNSFVLKPPFVKTETDESSSDIVSTNIAQAALTGNLTLVGNTAALGGGSNRALVGNFITVSSGKSKLQVTVKLHEQHNLVASALFGGAHAAADVLIEVTGGTGSDTQSQATNISTVIAPVFFFARDQGTADHVVTKTFTIASSGGEFFVRAGMRSDFEAGGGAGASVGVNALVFEIDVLALP
jgi:hypothetical protein